jgi:predicted Ser/Thr protein kinase
MLKPSDVVAAKLLCQLGYVDVSTLREHMRGADSEEESELDLVSRLAWARLLDRDQYATIRRYTAMFAHIRHQAVYLRQLEQGGLAADEIYELVAQTEANFYRRRVGDLLVSMGRLGSEEAQGLEARVSKKLRKEDVRVLRRYRREDFAGVKRPLLPVSDISPGVFRIPVLFRTEHTLEQVNLARMKIELEGQPDLVTIDDDAGFRNADPAATFLPEANEASELEEDDDLFDVETRITDRVETEPKAKHSGVPRALTDLESIGPYVIEESLGQGGIGAVYLARRHGRGPLVAVKVLLTDLATEDDQMRFVREGRLNRLVNHECVVRILDEGTTDANLHYLVLSAVTGEDLRKRILKNPQGLEPQVALALCEQILEGLKAIHEAGIVHRDLKPENVVVLAGRSKVTILDFGIARLFEDMSAADEEAHFRTAIGAISGSPAYVAPETILGEAFDPRADIYSMGVLMFELLSGKRPLQAETSYGFLQEHLIGVPSTLAEARPEKRWLPELESLIARMLAKEVTYRPGSAAEVLETLRSGLVQRTLFYLEANDGVVSDNTPFNPYYRNPAL